MRTAGKKIAIVANSAWNIYNFRLHLVKDLLNEEHQIVVIAPIDEYIHSITNLPHVHFIPLKQLDRKSTNPWQDVRLFFELLAIFRKERPQLVINYTIKPNIYGNLAAACIKIPSICIVTGLGYTFLNKGFVNYISRQLYKVSFNYAAKVLFENPDDEALFINREIVTAAKSAHTYGCGVDTDYFMPQPIFLPKRKNDPFIFLFIGRLLYDKGIVEYVEAARILQQKGINAECWILGELDFGNPSVIDEHSLVAWMESGLIHYKGFIKDVRPYIAQCDVLVHPSYRESLARVIQEALAMQKPVIASDITGCREAIDEGKNGLLVPVKDAEALAAAMLRISQLSAPQLAAMGAYGREKAIREFDVQKINQDLIAIFGSVIPLNGSVHTGNVAINARS